MSLLHIPLLEIDEARLQALITSGAAESRTIDYKRTTYGTANADYSEFLADVSSFANTSGGDLVLGIDALHGIRRFVFERDRAAIGAGQPTKNQ
jgi:hypothetical protein